MKHFTLKLNTFISKIPDTNKTSITIHFVLLILCLVIYLFKMTFIPMHSLKNYHLSLMAVLILNIGFLTFRSCSVTLLNNFSLACGYLYLTRANIAWGGLQSPYLIWAVFVVVCSAFFSRTRGYIFWAFLALLHPILVFWLARYFPQEIQIHYKNNLIELANGSSIQTLIILFSLTMITFSKEASKRYKKVYESKSIMAELVRILSYDIGGPTHTIKRTAEHLKGTYPANEQETKSIDKVINAAHVIQTITARVQELKDLGDASQSLTLHYFDLNEACEKVILLFQEKANKKNIIVNFIPYENHCPVYATKDILSFQILPNIISNSIKFSKSGQTIDIITEPHKITIRDHGIGIPENMLDKIFSYENHTNRLGTQGEKGTGFGMPLVRTLLERMEAQIQIRSWDINVAPDQHGTEIEINFKRHP